jgi:hypothetical protein
MPKRLVEQLAVGDEVEITFGEGAWYPGVVIGLNHPGVWVKLLDGSRWFVTHVGRIRKTKPSANIEEAG